MAEARPDIERARVVKVGLVGGEELFGHVTAFSPSDDHLKLEESRDRSGAPVERIVPTSSIAYIAYRNRDAHGKERDRTPRVALRVHLPRGKTTLVQPLTDPNNALGFLASPLDPDRETEEIYFYAHGGNRVERDEQIGSMLMRAEVLDGEVLEKGLQHQESQPRRLIGEILLAQNKIGPVALDQGLALQVRKRARIGEVLVEAGLATADDIDAALIEQRQSGRQRLGEILIEMGVVDESVLAQTLAKKFHIPFVDLDTCIINPDAAPAIPRWILEKHNIFPIDIDLEDFTIALSDPLNTEAIDLVRFQRREKLREVVATPTQVARYVNEFLAKEDAQEERSELEALLVDVDVDSSEAAAKRDESDGFEVCESDGAVIHLANQIIVEAFERNASDIHIEPRLGHRGTGIRIRIDGLCSALPLVPGKYGRALISRIKIMAKLDISETRKPQDGKLKIRIADRTIELRVATVPTVGGEDVVLRILPASGPMAVDQMDFSDANLNAIKRLLLSRHGLFLCVGPTGSGKTTSLHSLLGHINTPDRKIWTAEDPVEITQPGIRQVEVKPKIGFGFAEALRAFLRADPDVVMVGEMRDPETAAIAITASLTGHLVLSTLHTNSAPETAVRLSQMGLDPFSVGDALLGILAQRLTRRLCASCRSLEPASESDRKALQAALEQVGFADRVGNLLWRARGCSKCEKSGYRGRIAVHELMVIDEKLRTAIQARASADEIRGIAVEAGMKTMLQDGLQKCLSGATDLRQVRAVCGV